MKRNRAPNEADINFLSEKIKKLSKSTEDKKLKEKLGKAIDNLSEVRKKFSANSLENKLRRKYKWFSGDLEEEYFDLEDILVDIQSVDPDPEASFVSWCQAWILYRYRNWYKFSTPVSFLQGAGVIVRESGEVILLCMPTYSRESMQLGSPLPAFRLVSVCGEAYDSEQFRGKPLVVVFLCGHCPYVQAVEERYLALARAYIPRGVRWVGIASNDPTLYPQEDSPEALCRRYHEKEYPFPILFDDTQEVARAFQAVCTPEFFVYDAQGRLYYHGRLDDNWKDPRQVSREELREALEALLAGRPAPSPQYPAMGCSIKWRSPVS